MNNLLDPSESTDKGDYQGPTLSVINIGQEDLEVGSADKEWAFLAPKHFQQKFTYYTFANIHAMDPDSSDMGENKYPYPSSSHMTQHKGASYHVRRSHRANKTRSGRSRDRRSEGETQEHTDRSVISAQTSSHSVYSPPLLEISEEVYAVRQAALTVMEPLTYGWLIMTLGACISAELATAYFLNLLPHFRYWFILLPCWMAHFGIFICHILSFRALSIFITDANENRQREDTTDPFDRTEYLPILQRSLKFSLKMGMISGSMLLFEILIYIRIAKESISLSRMLTPLWVIATMGILNGIVCKTQHLLSLLSWILLFVFMMLLILRIDYGFTLIGANVIVAPVMLLLSLVTCIWLYILYGHKVGYFRLTQWQVKASLLYCLGSVICLISIILLVNWWSYYPFGAGMRFLMCVLTPLTVALMGFGAWSVNRDEFERLLRYGGQVAVHPMKLRFEKNGWTAVDGIGVVTVPMLGIIEYEPLKMSLKKDVELCCCCECYAYEDDIDSSATEPLTYSRIALQNSETRFSNRGSSSAHDLS